MNVKDLAQIEGLTAVYISDDNQVITAGYCGDLLSDVMANAPADSVMMTIQAHKNTIAVASLVGIVALVICNDRSIGDDMLAAAKEENISLFTTALTHFEAAQKIYPYLNL